MTNDTDRMPTCDQAIKASARILENAEMTTDLALMQRLEGLADSWRALAWLLKDKEEG